MLLPLSGADDLAENQSEFKKLQDELKSLQVKLAKSQKETNAQRKALADVESQLASLQSSTKKLAENIASQKAILLKLGEQEVALNEKLDSKADDINAILRLAYKQNNQPIVKLLLSGERPEDLSRHLYYFSRLTGNQQGQLNAWLAERQLLADTLTAQTQITRSLQSKSVELESQYAELKQKKNKRAQVLANLEAQSETTEQAISRNVQEREKLAGLIKEIEQRIAKMNLDVAQTQELTRQQGQLNWPVQGKLTNRYGRTMSNSRLKWQGWVIAADEGEPVQAVAAGRVVFADFFKSNGLLIIIDHGQGMLTLYGRNQSLLREVGSWVNSGDVIAEVGQSGGYNQSGLYFEVRKNGEPLNPASWLRKR